MPIAHPHIYNGGRPMDLIFMKRHGECKGDNFQFGDGKVLLKTSEAFENEPGSLKSYESLRKEVAFAPIFDLLFGESELVGIDLALL